MELAVIDSESQIKVVRILCTVHIQIHRSSILEERAIFVDEYSSKWLCIKIVGLPMRAFRASLIALHRPR